MKVMLFEADELGTLTGTWYYTDSRLYTLAIARGATQ